MFAIANATPIKRGPIRAAQRGMRAAWSAGRRALTPRPGHSVAGSHRGEEVGGPHAGDETLYTTHDFRNTKFVYTPMPQLTLEEIDRMNKRIDEAEKELYRALLIDTVYAGEK